MRGDLRVVGAQNALPRRIAASATRFEAGEPCYLDGATLSSGVASSNTYELMDADGIVLGTDTFGGIFIKNAIPIDSGTLIAQTAMCSCPVPNLGRLRGRAETTANVDTDSEILAIINDVTLIDYNSTGASDGGELYTIKDVASADTSFATIVEGDYVKQTLDVVIDPRSYRIANDIS